MKTSEIDVRALRIEDVPGLDPVTVFLQDFGGGRGRLTVECYGEAWTAYWGAMHAELRKFVTSCELDYLATKMQRPRETKRGREYLLRILAAVQAALREHR